MANIYNETITASGNIVIPLDNHRRDLPQKYTVHLYGGFGGGTVTAFLNPAGKVSAEAGTTDDIAILDGGNTGTAISKTAKYTFNFECNSGSGLNLTPTVLKLILTGATTPTLKVRVDSAT